MKPLNLLPAALAVAAVVCSFTGCGGGDSSGPPAGAQCVVQFRRDALGAAANLPVPPRTGSINGAETAIYGKLKHTRGEWIVLDRGSKDVWVPKSVVLLIEFQ
jgi:hypothetical protein